MSLEQVYRRIRGEIPEHVTIVAAAKTRTPDAVMKALEAGITDIGENYVQEAENMRQALGSVAENLRWHMIGHLQKNKINKALGLFDVIQTVDSFKLAEGLNKRLQHPLDVLIEVNSGREAQKSGVFPEEVEVLARQVASLKKISVKGLMTMGPRFGDPEEARPYFTETRRLFEQLRSLQIPGVHMDVLSMGMSNAYRVAVEEGSTMIRLGTVLFGEREP